MGNLFDHFDRIRIVNLATRKDRRREMSRELRRVGLDRDPRVEFFDAIVKNDPGRFKRMGSNGAYHSHLALLEEAAEAGESILILQDDCDFTPDVTSYQLPAEWAVFYGGYDASNPDDPHNSDIIGAHFMGFSAEAARLSAIYLKRLLNEDCAPDPRAAAESDFDAAILPPIDGALVWFRRAHPQLKTVFAMLGHQRPSRTDIGEPRLFDKLPLIRQGMGIARRVKRALNVNARSDHYKPLDG